MAEKFADLMTQMWKKGEHTISPREFKTQIGIFAPQFTGYNQQDSHELLAYVLDALHEDLNGAYESSYGEVMPEMIYTESVRHSAKFFVSIFLPPLPPVVRRSKTLMRDQTWK